LLHIDDLRRIVAEEGEPINAQDVEDLLDEAMMFADGNGMVDYRAFAEMMLSA
jgi:Ca2+-binding EF-hand superfamily protein